MGNDNIMGNKIKVDEEQGIRSSHARGIIIKEM